MVSFIPIDLAADFTDMSELNVKRFEILAYIET